MGLFAKSGNEERPVSNPRAANGPPEGDPGSTITITITDVFPPLVIVATVEDDGWFADSVYDQIAAARATG